MKYLMIVILVSIVVIAQTVTNAPPRRFAGPHDLGPVIEFPVPDTNQTLQLVHDNHVANQAKQKAYRDGLVASPDLVAVTADKSKQIETAGIVEGILLMLDHQPSIAPLKEDQIQGIISSGIERIQSLTGSNNKAAIARLFEVKEAKALWAAIPPATAAKP